MVEFFGRARRLQVFAAVLLFYVLCGALCPPVARAATGEKDPLSAVKEGWGWPVVVIPPPSGWESKTGETIKLGLRAAEREISLQRSGIRGREVIFMFANLRDAKEIPQRMATWRGMKVAAIISFGGGERDSVLRRLCATAGPSVIFAGGENLKIIDPASGEPYPYLFALDLPYFARANALAELAAAQKPQRKVAIFSDVLSERIAKGARLNDNMLNARKIGTLPIWVSATREDQFNLLVGEVESGGAGIITSWLEGMATLSIWRTANLNQKGTKVFYAGSQQKILLDAEGLTLVDKDALLQRNERGKRDIIMKVRDMFGKVVSDPALAAKAYALGRWAIGAYSDESNTDPASIAKALEIVRDIPLMDETLYINRRTHRPTTRQFGVLTVVNRKYQSSGKVEVNSSEAVE